MQGFIYKEFKREKPPKPQTSRNSTTNCRGARGFTHPVMHWAQTEARQSGGVDLALSWGKPFLGGFWVEVYRV